MVKRIVLGIVVLVVAAGVWMAARAQPVAVDVARVARGTVRSLVEEEGKTRVIDRFIVAAPVPGRLLRVGLEEGDPVKKGDLAAEIDPLPLKSRVEQTEAQIRSLESRIVGAGRKKPKPEELDLARLRQEAAKRKLEVAERELEEAEAALLKAGKDAARALKLRETNASTEAELDSAEAARDQAQARVQAQRVRVALRGLEIRTAKLDSAVLDARLHDFEWEEADYKDQIAGLRATLASLRDDLRRTRVLVPANGCVLGVLEESERVVPAGTPLLEVGDLGRLEVEADFLSEDVAHMRVGMPAEIFGRALGDRVVPGTVTRIYPSAFKKISSLGVEQQRVTVVVGFDSEKASLGDRYRVEVRVILAQAEDALLVPEGALFRHEGGWYVFAVRGAAARLTSVRTGLRDGRVREVLEGLDEDDRVILHPDPELEDGAPIEAMAGSE